MNTVTTFVTYNVPEQPTVEEAKAAVAAFSKKDIEDCAWLTQTYLIDRGLEVPANVAPEIAEFMEIWDADFDCLLPDFSRDEGLERIRNIFGLTRGVIEKEIRRQHEMDVEIMMKLRNLLIANR